MNLKGNERLLLLRNKFVLSLICFLAAVCVYAQVPRHVDPSEYGINEESGKFVHPQQAPYFAYSGARPVPGSLDYLEQRDYTHNMEVLGHWDIIVRTGHSWQHFVDIEKRRYMFHYYRHKVNVYDVTDPVNLKIVLQKEYTDGSWFGAAAIAYNDELQKWVMIQSFEVPRSVGGMGGKKYERPEAAEAIRNFPGLRGFRVYELLGPKEWKLLSEVSMDVLNPNSEIQEGPGGFDVPTYTGGKYAYMLGGPDNTFDRMEFPNQLYSPIHMIYDMQDPGDPRLLSTWWVPGQRRGEENSYKKWRQFGNRTSWTGGRLPLAVPENQSGDKRYGYTVMGGLGFYVLDVSDPTRPQTVAHLNLPMSVGGVEGDNVDASRAVERGFVLSSGYPMNEDCYEPWKDVYIIDVKDPGKPNIIGTLPRPMPPAEAPYADYCLRRAKFGPKRPSPSYSPGRPNPNITVYPYFNAGIQVFDISDPRNAEIVAYYVPPLAGDFSDPQTYNSPVESLHVEWDRNLIWTFTNSGIYLLSTPALGRPVLE